MTTQPLYLNRHSQAKPASGIAVLFFLLGAPSIYGALRQRAKQPTTKGYLPLAMGLGILMFVLAGTSVCLNALA